MVKDQRINLRVDLQTKEQLQQIANVQNRKLSNYIEMLLKKELEKNEKDHPNR